MIMGKKVRPGMFYIKPVAWAPPIDHPPIWILDD
jgi:hypothetical protein